MEAILKFNLPEETTEHTIAINAQNMHSSIVQVRNSIHRKLKYDTKLSAAKRKFLEEMQAEITQILEDNNVLILF